ncbi:MAG TPA: hypothetical protein VID27_00550, partial [Blastocatellia bacterium]
MLFEVPLFPEDASTGAQHVDSFFYFMVGICGFVAILVCCLILVFVIKYRRRYEDQKSQPVGSHRWL